MSSDELPRLWRLFVAGDLEEPQRLSRGRPKIVERCLSAGLNEKDTRVCGARVGTVVEAYELDLCGERAVAL